METCCFRGMLNVEAMNESDLYKCWCCPVAAREQQCTNRWEDGDPAMTNYICNSMPHLSWRLENIPAGFVVHSLSSAADAGLWPDSAVSCNILCSNTTSSQYLLRLVNNLSSRTPITDH